MGILAEYPQIKRFKKIFLDVVVRFLGQGPPVAVLADEI